MKIALTGGHITPALAVIDECQKNDKIIFFGRKHQFKNEKKPSFEYKTITQKKIPFRSVESGRFYRNISHNTLKELLKIPQATKTAYRDLKEDKPDVLITFGGYISIPVGIAARLHNIPIIIHEQTFDAGLANRLLARISTKICISHESSRKLFPRKKTVLTGNPIRKDVIEIKRKLFLPRGKVLYITGGSTGSQVINRLVRDSVEELALDYVVIHQTGDSSLTGDYQESVKRRNSLPSNIRDKYVIKKHIPPDEIGWILKNASVVVSRAGINTVQELLLLKKNAVLIPLETGQKNEQLKNANWYNESGLGVILRQKDLSPDSLKQAIAQATGKKQKKSFTLEENGAKKVYNIATEVYEKSKKNP